MKHQICRNCGQTVEGTYCSNCGQKNDVERLRLATLAESFISTFVGDGAIGEKRNNVRYGFMLTLWSIITRPGTTTEEYLEGRRRKYFNPVTILLLLSGFYALVAVFLGVVDDTPKPSDSEVIYFINVVMAYSKSHPAMLHLFMLPFMALAFKWFFRRRSDLRYIEMIYIGIFTAVFAVTTNILELPFKAIPALEGASGWVSAASYGAMCWCAAMIFRKLFRISWRRAITYWIATYIISFIMAVIAVLLLVIASMGTYYLVDKSGYKKTFDVVLSDDGIFAEDAPDPADSLKTK